MKSLKEGRGDIMRTFSVTLCLLSLFSTAALRADPPATTPAPFVRGTPFDAGCQPDMRVWAEADYLYWWTKNSSLPVAVVTKGSASDAKPAALGQHGTRVLFGEESIHNGALSGFRLTVCSWIDKNNNYAVEGSGFYLPEKTSTLFSKQSSSVLGVPFYNEAHFPLPAGHGGWSRVGPKETALCLGFSPLDFTGKITAKSSTELWGVELNGLFHFLSLPTFRLSALGGVCYVDLDEQLDFSFYNIGASEKIFRAATIKDHFRTHNEIYAGQIGLRGEWSHNWLFASFLAKVGLGGASQIAHISGSFSDLTPNLYYSYGVGSSGGIFAQPTNTGKHSQTRFVVIPTGTVRFGANLHRSLRIFCGYDFLFINNVLRPGNQIDRKINETQVGSASGSKPTLSGPHRPKALMDTTSYWAQGINAGIEARF